MSSYVVIRLKIKQQKTDLTHKGSSMSFKDTCKLLALLAGFTSLLGLSWIILLFTVVGADTNIYAAFAIQWLFVFFNSLQGFFLFVFYVALNRDTRNLWFDILCHRKKSGYSTRSKHILTSGNMGKHQNSLNSDVKETSLKTITGILIIIFFSHNTVTSFLNSRHPYISFPGGNDNSLLLPVGKWSYPLKGNDKINNKILRTCMG